MYIVRKRENCTSVRYIAKEKREREGEKKLIDIYQPIGHLFSGVVFLLVKKEEEKKKRWDLSLCSSIRALEKKDQIETMRVYACEKKSNNGGNSEGASGKRTNWNRKKNR